MSVQMTLNGYATKHIHSHFTFWGMNKKVHIHTHIHNFRETLCQYRPHNETIECKRVIEEEEKKQKNCVVVIMYFFFSFTQTCLNV